MSAPESSFADRLRELADRPEILTTVHLAIENELIDLRDRRMSVGLNGNGLVVKEKDGTPSPMIRLGTRDAIRMILRTLADEVAKEEA